MNAKYFKEEICEELDGASDYLKKAIDTFKSHPEWSKKFWDMSEAEQNHAACLYKMFMELYSESEGKDPYMISMRDGIMNCFSSNMRRIEDLKASYGIMSKEQSNSMYSYGEEDV